MGERLLCKQEVTGSIPVGSIDEGACKWLLPLLIGGRFAAQNLSA
jgi:hypothetical protein